MKFQGLSVATCAMMRATGPSHFSRSQRLGRGHQMSHMRGCLLILLVSTLCLTGCLYLRPVGPCYGVGCPALTSSQNAPQNQGQPPAAQSQTTQAQAASEASSQGESSQNQGGQSQANVNQTAPAQKPVPKKSFFSHLIPWKHSNSGN
jgi:hypothetical protein